MFESFKPRYMTKTVSETVSGKHLMFMLQYIGGNQEALTDYLQVFEFYVENGEQWLVQRQEVPERETTIYGQVYGMDPIHQTIWVMDQETYVMFLLPSDY